MTERSTAQAAETCKFAVHSAWKLLPARLALAGLLAAGMLLHSPSVSAQGSPVGCGYGTGGPFAANICWFNMAGYNDAAARSGGQLMTVTLPGGYQVRFLITSSPAGAPQHPIVDPRAVPIETRFAFGVAGYVGIPGLPVLYSRDAGTNGVNLRLSNITVVDATNAPVSGYSFVVADAENNIQNENFTWTSDQPLNLIGVLSPTAVKGCQAGLVGVGTTTVTCTGQGVEPPILPAPRYDAVIIGANTPSEVGLSMQTFARSGVAFGIMTSKIALSKAVVGRIHASDSFDVTVTSPEGSTVASVSTGGANSATTGELTVLPRSSGSYTLTDAATPGSGTVFEDYARMWTCSNNGVPVSLPSPGASSISIQPAAGDFIQCTVTNTFLPRPGIALEKTGQGPQPLSASAQIAYSFRITNTGNVPLTNVTVADPLPGLSPIGCPGTALAVGANMTCTAIYTITQADADSGILQNTATASGQPPGNGPPTTAQDSVVLPPSQAPGISLVKSASGPIPLTLGSVITYTFVVSNTGNLTLTNVTILDALPGLSPINCPGTTLAPAQAMTCTATYAVTQSDVQAGIIRNSATATDTPPSGLAPPTATSDTSIPPVAPVPAAPQIVLVLLMGLLGLGGIWLLRRRHV